MKTLFPSMQTTLSTPNACVNGDKHREVLLARADRLLAELRSNPMSTTTKNTRKRRKHVGKCKEYQRSIVVIDYPGDNPPAVRVLHDYDKVYEGTLLFNVNRSEDEVREEITHLVQQKKSTFMDFSKLQPEDFIFVKCSNRRIRVPDGKAVYDGNGIKELYRSANIYVRLMKSFDKHKVVHVYVHKNLLYCHNNNDITFLQVSSPPTSSSVSTISPSTASCNTVGASSSPSHSPFPLAFTLSSAAVLSTACSSASNTLSLSTSSSSAPIFASINSLL